MSVSDPYKVLQVDPEADAEVIEAAYRRLARKYHPDVSPDPESHEKMVAINQAWEQLRDPVKRAAVDRARRRSNGAAAWVAAAEAHVQTRSSGAGSTSSAPIRQPPPASTSRASAGATAGAATDGTWPFGSMSDPAAGAPADTAASAAPRTWTTGRVPVGGFSSGAFSRPDGEGAAGPPPGNPSGSVLTFGRYAGWSLGEVARTEIDYLEWLDRMPIGRVYQQEIDELLRAKGVRSKPSTPDQRRGGPFRRR